MCIFLAKQNATSFQAPGDPKVCINTGFSLDELMSSLSENLVSVVNNSFGAHLSSYLGLEVIGIYGGHETVEEWGPVFGDSHVLHTNEICSPCHIADISDCYNEFRCLNSIPVMLVHAKVLQLIAEAYAKKHDPTLTIGNQPRVARSTRDIKKQLIHRIVKYHKNNLGDEEAASVSMCIARNILIRGNTRQLLIDVSELVVQDSGSGIQRVVKNVLKELFSMRTKGQLKEYVIEPIYAKQDQSGFFYARQFVSNLLETNKQQNLTDELVEYANGDIYLGLDLQPHLVFKQKKLLEFMRNHGVKIKFVIYDLLPIQYPEYFVDGTEKAFRNWVNIVLNGDAAICISKTVSNQLRNMLSEAQVRNQRPLDISWFHLGSDIKNSIPSHGLPAHSRSLLARIESRCSFLMVGTIEPRKGHKKALPAFDKLWRTGLNLNLVIVGKQGWMMEDFCTTVRQHSELGNRLFWLDQVSDEFLDKIYDASTCLIAASEGEGFGLPLIEAAQKGLPIIASDLEVFREIAGDGAFYYQRKQTDALENAVRKWYTLYESKQHPKSK